MSERSHHHHPVARPHSWLMSVRRKAPSLTHRPDPPASPTSSFSSVSWQRRVLNRGKQTAVPLSSKTETDESGSFSLNNACRLNADCPLEDIAYVHLAQTKDTKITRCQITKTQIHKPLKCLASARHDKSNTFFLPVECRLKTKESLKTKKRMTYSILPAPLYTVVTPVGTS